MNPFVVLIFISVCPTSLLGFYIMIPDSRHSNVELLRVKKHQSLPVDLMTNVASPIRKSMLPKSRQFLGIILLPYIICYFAENGVWPSYPASMQHTVAEMGQLVLSQNDESIRTFCTGKLNQLNNFKSQIFHRLFHKKSTEFTEQTTSMKTPTATNGTTTTAITTPTGGITPSPIRTTLNMTMTTPSMMTPATTTNSTSTSTMTTPTTTTQSTPSPTTPSTTTLAPLKNTTEIVNTTKSADTTTETTTTSRSTNGNNGMTNSTTGGQPISSAIILSSTTDGLNDVTVSGVNGKLDDILEESESVKNAVILTDLNQLQDNFKRLLVESL